LTDDRLAKACVVREVKTGLSGASTSARPKCKSHLVDADKVNILTLEAFVALAKRGEL
jgi:hypothetical protein